MKLFLFTLGYLTLIAISIFLIYWLNTAIKAVRQNKIQIDELEQTTYSNLREVQFQSRELIKQIKSFLKGQNNVLGEMVSNILIATLPFKKIKSLIYLKKLAKK